MEEAQIVHQAVAWVPLLIGAKMFMGGAKAGIEDESAGIREAGQNIFEETKKLLGRSKNLAYDTANLAIDKAESTKEQSFFSAGYGTRKKNVSTLKAGDQLYRKGGMSTQTEIDDVVQSQVNINQDVYQKTNTLTADAFSMSVDAAEIAKDKADIAYDEGVANAQQNLNAVLADADSRDKNFFEGLIGS